jgi:hypothetical protein
LQSKLVAFAIVLAEILGYVVKMRAEILEPLLASAGIQNSRTRGDLLESLLQPGDSCGFVMGANLARVNFS